MTSTTVPRIRRTVAAALTALAVAVLGACSGSGSDDDGGSALPQASSPSDDGGSTGSEDGSAAGSDDGSASGDGEGEEDAGEPLDPEDAMLAYAQCMRDHGIAMADPGPDGSLSIDGANSTGDLDAAEKACEELQRQAMPQEGGAGLSEEEKQRMLDTAQCMRDRGHDVPDPNFDGGRTENQDDSGATGGGGGGPAPDDPAFMKDAQECAAEHGVEGPSLSEAP